MGKHKHEWVPVAAAILAVGAPPLVIFVLPALSLVARNIDYFPARYVTARPFFLLALIWLVFGAFITLTWHRGIVIRYLATLYMLSAPVWSLHILALRTTQSTSVSVVAALIWFSVAGLAARATRETALQYSAILVVPLLLGSAVTLAVASPAGAPTTTASQPTSPEPTADLPNVYHLIFDEYQTDIFEHLLDDELRHDLRGFVLFGDTIATYGRTEISLPSTFASDDYRYDIPPAEYIAQAFAGSGNTLNILGELGYHRVGYVHNFNWLGGDESLDQFFRHDDIVDLSTLPGYEDLLISLWIYVHTPESVSSRLLPAHHQTQLAAEVLLPDDVPPRSVASLRELIRHEPHLPDRGRYTIAHFILPHFPYVMTPDCGYVPGETTGPLEQAACTNLLITEFIGSLRDLGRLEDSIVIIHSDHGSWYEIVDGQLNHLGENDRFSEAASRARARSLLLAHLPNSPVGEPDELVISSRSTTLDDIMPTIFDVLGVSQGFSGNRMSLLSDPPVERPRYYHFYRRQRDGSVVRGPLVRYRAEDGQVVHDRDIELPDKDS